MFVSVRRVSGGGGCWDCNKSVCRGVSRSFGLRLIDVHTFLPTATYILHISGDGREAKHQEE